MEMNVGFNELMDTVERTWRYGNRDDAVEIIRGHYGDDAFFDYLAEHGIDMKFYLIEEYKTALNRNLAHLPEHTDRVRQIANVVDAVSTSNEPLWDVRDGIDSARPLDMGSVLAIIDGLYGLRTE